MSSIPAVGVMTDGEGLRDYLLSISIWRRSIWMTNLFSKLGCKDLRCSCSFSGIAPIELDRERCVSRFLLPSSYAWLSSCINVRSSGSSSSVSSGFRALFLYCSKAPPLLGWEEDGLALRERPILPALRVTGPEASIYCIFSVLAWFIFLRVLI